MALDWDLWNGEGADGHDYSQSIYDFVKKRVESLNSWLPSLTTPLTGVLSKFFAQLEGKSGLLTEIGDSIQKVFGEFLVWLDGELTKIGDKPQEYIKPVVEWIKQLPTHLSEWKVQGA